MDGCTIGCNGQQLPLSLAVRSECCTMLGQLVTSCTMPLQADMLARMAVECQLIGGYPCLPKPPCMAALTAGTCLQACALSNEVLQYAGMLLVHSAVPQLAHMVSQAWDASTVLAR